MYKNFLNVRAICIVVALFSILFFISCDPDVVDDTPTPAGTFGIYSEDTAHPVDPEPELNKQDATISAVSTAVTPYEGSYVLKVDYTANNPSKLTVRYVDQEADISDSTDFIFAINTSSMTGFADIQIAFDDAGVMLSAYTPDQTVGDWQVYSIPLSDLVSGSSTGGFDIYNPVNSDGTQISGTIYFDDMYFE